MIGQEEGKMEAVILAGNGPLAKKEEKGDTRSYFEMPDGTLVFDQTKLAETTEGYQHYARW